jgi:hypothetical protein
MPEFAEIRSQHFQIPTSWRTEIKKDLRERASGKDNETRIDDALGLLISAVDELEVRQRDLFSDDTAPDSSLVRLRELLPDQKIAPVQFEVAENRLVVLSKRSGFDQADATNIGAAREELLANGVRILDELQRSNCDRRLIETVSYLQSQISGEENIVKVGMASVGCEVMHRAFEQELPDAVSAMLHASLQRPCWLCACTLTMV